MKILYITTVRIPTEKAHGVQIMKMCEAIASLGHTVELVVPRQLNKLKDDPFTYYAVDRTFTITYANAIGFGPYNRIGYWIHRLTFALAAIWLTKQHHADLLYTRDELIAGFLSLLHKRFIFEVHEGRWNAFMRRATFAASRTVVLTKGLADYLVERGVPKEKIHVAPDAVDQRTFQNPESLEAARLRLELPLHEKIALYIGRIDDWKGTDTFFKSAALMPSNILVAVIGGEEQQIADLKKSYPKVLFLGYRPYRELANNQAAADVLILPNSAKHDISTRDTSPLKLFSYMASGKPIVASDVPSLREILDEKTASFFKPDDPASLARAIEYTLEDSVSASKRAEAARVKVQQFSWENRAKLILASLNDSAFVR